MLQTTDSELSPTTIRAASIGTIVAVCVMAIGFAPIPALWYFLVAGIGISLIVFATGPKLTNFANELPTISMILIPAVLAAGFRFTSLVWVVVPALAFVGAAAAWMLVTNRDTETTAAATAEPAHQLPSDELAPKREEKTAVTNDESSATAA